MAIQSIGGTQPYTVASDLLPKPVAPVSPTPVPNTPATTASPLTLQDGTQLDSGVVKVLHAIRGIESNGNYQAVGDNGTSYGAFQWNNGKKALEPGQLPVNFINAAKEFGLDANDFSPANQNKVAYAQISKYKSEGLTPIEIDALWNGASKDETGKYVHNNAQRATQFQKALAQEAAQTPQQDSVPPPIQQESSSNPSFLDNLKGGNFLGAAKQAGDFAFPIVGDLANDFHGTSTKSTLQQLGDAGLSALWFLPFGDLAEGATGAARLALGATKGAEEASKLVAEALPTAENAAKAASLTQKGNIAKLAGTVATGVGAGYAGDVANNASQGKTGTDILKPGLGTLAGGAIPAALSGASSVYNKFAGQSQIIDKIQQAYADAAGATKSGIKAASKTAQKGLDSEPEFLAHAGILPETEEINGRRVFTTGADSASQTTLNGRITDLKKLLDSGIEKAGEKVPVGLEDMRSEMLGKASNEFSGTALESVQKHINDEFDAYKNQFGDGKGNITLTDANKIKLDLQSKTSYDATRPSITTQANKMMSNVAKRTVEDKAKEVGLKDVEGLNRVIQQHGDAIDFLNRINGQTVKGGRLGKYIYEGGGMLAGNAIGKAVGSTLGSPALGEVAGTLAGGAVGGLLAKFVQKFASGGTISAAAVGRMAAQEPEAVQNFLEYIGKKGGFIAPVLKPEAKAGIDTVQEALTKIPGNAVLRMFDRDSAKKAGYSDEEIDSFLNSEMSASE